MTKEEQIYDYLCKYCVGKDNRVKNYELRKKFNVLGDKSLRKIIENIRLNSDMKEIVASIAGPDGGYWIANSKEDCEETINHLENRARMMVELSEVIYGKMERKYEN